MKVHRRLGDQAPGNDLASPSRSREHLARRFRLETGSTVHRYVIHVRLSHAAAEVQVGDKVEAVMLGVGYRSKRNFYRQFKRQYGSTPGTYRHAGAIAPRRAAADYRLPPTDDTVGERVQNSQHF
jgi:AraC-like DNA-binding protein